MISVVIHGSLLLKYGIPYGLEGLGNFRKHRGTLFFLITTGLNTLNPLEETKNATVSHSFDFLPPLHFSVFFANPASGRALKKNPDLSSFQISSVG